VTGGSTARDRGVSRAVTGGVYPLLLGRRGCLCGPCGPWSILFLELLPSKVCVVCEVRGKTFSGGLSEKNLFRYSGKSV